MLASTRAKTDISACSLVLQLTRLSAEPGSISKMALRPAGQVAGMRWISKTSTKSTHGPKLLTSTPNPRLRGRAAVSVSATGSAIDSRLCSQPKQQMAGIQDGKSVMVARRRSVITRTLPPAPLVQQNGASDHQQRFQQLLSLSFSF